VPPDAPLSVGPYNGTVYTRVALDFERQQVRATSISRSFDAVLGSVGLLIIIIKHVNDTSLGEDAIARRLQTPINPKTPDPRN
jgi:hypothetical protein